MIINKRRRSFYWLAGMWIILALFAYSRAEPPQKSPYEQIRIPLGMQTGVPFEKDHEGNYSIDGFEIDSSGNIYFLGGNKATLACFTKDRKSSFRKTYPHLVAGEMKIVGGSLFVFESGEESLNTIVELNKTNGSVIKEYPNVKKVLASRGCLQIDSYIFIDSMLKIRYIDSEGIEKTKFACFDLHGELLPDCKERSSAAIAKEVKFEHLGRYGNNYVLGKFIEDGKKFLVSLRDPSDKTLADTSIDTKYLEDPFCGTQGCMPPDHRKVRNNKFYWLNRDGNIAAITVIDLATFVRK
jgi:hypothetical protein